MKTQYLFVVIAWCVCSIASADDPGSAYMKNSGTAPMHVWINGVYQGHLNPGETRYTVSDGFITDDSDRPTEAGGRTATRESHGGWENSSNEKITVTYQFGDGEKETRDVSVNERGEAIFGATNKEGAKP